MMQTHIPRIRTSIEDGDVAYWLILTNTFQHAAIRIPVPAGQIAKKLLAEAAEKE